METREITPAAGEDPRLASKLAWEYTVFTLTAGRVPIGFLLALIAAAAILAGWAAVIGTTWAAIALAVLIVLWMLTATVQFLLVRSSIAAAYPPGTVGEVWVGETGMRSTSAMGEQTLSYAAIRRVFTTEHLVIIHLRAGLVRFIEPRASFTPEQLALLHRRVAESAPA